MEQHEKAIYCWNNAKYGLDIIALLTHTWRMFFFSFSDSDHACCKPEQNQCTLSGAFRPDHLRESVCGGLIMDVSQLSRSPAALKHVSGAVCPIEAGCEQLVRKDMFSGFVSAPAFVRTPR